MKRAYAGLLMIAIAASPAQAASPLAIYRGSARVLVVSAPQPAIGELLLQMDALHRAASGLRERDLVVVQVEGGDAKDDTGGTLDADAVRRALQLPADRFAVLLVGKDGGVKLRSDQAISMTELFGTIDAMPMRQNEMRRGASR